MYQSQFAQSAGEEAQQSRWAASRSARRALVAEAKAVPFEHFLGLFEGGESFGSAAAVWRGR